MDFNDLSPELIERGRACASAEELAQLAEEVGYDLSSEDLEAISGGVNWDCALLHDCPEYWKEVFPEDEFEKAFPS